MNETKHTHRDTTARLVAVARLIAIVPTIPKARKELVRAWINRFRAAIAAAKGR